MKNSSLVAALVMIVSCNAFAVECIKPNYARRALMTLYLEQEHPTISDRSISKKLTQKDAEAISNITLDIMFCFGKTRYCPDHKKTWTRDDHKKNGINSISKLKDSGRVSTEEAVFLLRKMDAKIEESECSDF